MPTSLKSKQVPWAPNRMVVSTEFQEIEIFSKIYLQHWTLCEFDFQTKSNKSNPIDLNLSDRTSAIACIQWNNFQKRIHSEKRKNLVKNKHLLFTKYTFCHRLLTKIDQNWVAQLWNQMIVWTKSYVRTLIQNKCCAWCLL